MTSEILKLIDVAVNLTDPVFRGNYHGKQKHEDDFYEIICRAKAAGIDKMIITGTNLTESKQALKMAEDNENGLLFSTVGCHPTQCQEFIKQGNPDEYYESLLQLAQTGIKSGKVVALGETGLDYDRLHFCPADIQKEFFIRQFQLARETGLPMFLHSRNTNGDMANLLGKYRSMFTTGVVHSFTEDAEALQNYVDLGLYIGVNGCSLKQKEQLEVIKKIPLDRLILETDAPWCEVRPTHASFPFTTPSESYPIPLPEFTYPQYPFPDYFLSKSNMVAQPERWKPFHMVRGRNEPSMLFKILMAVSQIRGEPTAVVAQAVYQNTMKLFFSKYVH